MSSPALRARVRPGRLPVPAPLAPRLARPDQREVHQIVARRPEPPKDPPLPGDGLEEILAPGDRLGRAEEQVSAFAQREVEQTQHPLLEVGLEVDQEVAAADQVQPRERRVLISDGMAAAGGPSAGAAPICKGEYHDAT